MAGWRASSIRSRSCKSALDSIAPLHFLKTPFSPLFTGCGCVLLGLSKRGAWLGLRACLVPRREGREQDLGVKHAGTVEMGRQRPLPRCPHLRGPPQPKSHPPWWRRPPSSRPGCPMDHQWHPHSGEPPWDPPPAAQRPWLQRACEAARFYAARSWGERMCVKGRHCGRFVWCSPALTRHVTRGACKICAPPCTSGCTRTCSGHECRRVRECSHWLKSLPLPHGCACTCLYGCKLRDHAPTSTSVCNCTRVSLCMRVCMCASVCVWVCVYMCVHVCMHVRVSSSCIKEHARAALTKCTSTHTHAKVYTLVCMQVYMRKHKHAHTGMSVLQTQPPFCMPIITWQLQHDGVGGWVLARLHVLNSMSFYLAWMEMPACRGILICKVDETLTRMLACASTHKHVVAWAGSNTPWKRYR